MLLFGNVFDKVRQSFHTLMRKCRRVKDGCILKKGQFTSYVVRIAQGGLTVFRDEVPFIDDNNTSLARFVNVAGDLLILLRHAFRPVEDENRHV